MASALLAVAFVVTTSRNRTVHEAHSHKVDLVAERAQAPLVDRSHPWYQSLAQQVEQQLMRLFHCAIPDGLDRHDFDLGDLPK